MNCLRPRRRKESRFIAPFAFVNQVEHISSGSTWDRECLVYVPLSRRKKSIATLFHRIPRRSITFACWPCVILTSKCVCHLKKLHTKNNNIRRKSWKPYYISLYTRWDGFIKKKYEEKTKEEEMKEKISLSIRLIC